MIFLIIHAVHVVLHTVKQYLVHIRDATTSVILSGIYCKSKSYLSFYYMVYCIQLSKFE